MKTLIRAAVAGVIRASGVGAVLRRVRPRALPILTYHRILPSELGADCPFPELAVTPQAFARHVDYCRRHYECLPLREAVERVGSASRVRKPLMTFTLDDGYWDNFEYARPILNASGVRATFFVVSSLVGSDEPPWYDRLARALQHLSGGRSQSGCEPVDLGGIVSRWVPDGKNSGTTWSIPLLVELAKSLDPAGRRNMVDGISRAAVAGGWSVDKRDRVMNPKELVQLASDGHEVASHTRTHPILTQLQPDELTREVEGSRSEVEAVIGESVSSFSYPNGDHNDEVVAAARRAGYLCAVTTLSGQNGRSTDPHRLRRTFISHARLSRPGGGCSTSVLALELAGLADAVFLRRRRNVVS